MDNEAPGTEPEAPAHESAPERAAAPHTAAYQAVLTRLRQSLLESDPAIEPALVAGESLEELEASFDAARTLVARVRQSVAREQAAAVPAGAPGRAHAPHGSPLEKIRAGLSADGS